MAANTTTTTEEHRQLLTESIDPDIAMHPYRYEPGRLQYMGLWGTWAISHGEPTAICIVLATVRTDCRRRSTDGEPTVRLGDLSWSILQFQTVDGSPNVNPCLWNDTKSILAEDLRLEKDGALMGCNSHPVRRLVYDPKQENQRVRSFADNEVLLAYKIRRIDDTRELADIPRPATTLERERVAYRVYNVIEGSPVHAPVMLFVEKAMPRNQMLCQRVQREKGFVKDGDLRGALGEGKMWIVLTGDDGDSLKCSKAPQMVR